MNDPAATVALFRRYAELIRSAIPSCEDFEPTVESATAVQVERGVVFPRVLRDRSAATAPLVDRLIELASSQRLPTVAVVDDEARHQPVYRPLLVYSWLQAFQQVYETLPRGDFGRWEEAIRPWCDLLELELAAVDWPPGSMPATLGASASESVWTALALHVAGKVYVRDAWTDLASHAFGKLLRSQKPEGTFLSAHASDNPETHRYHELVLLHAAASYAVQSEDRTVAAAVARSTRFHAGQTQPDHATSRPWGVFAFIWNPATHPLADQMLHTARLSGTEHLDGVSLMLLADALYCLELFIH